MRYICTWNWRPRVTPHPHFDYRWHTLRIWQCVRGAGEGHYCSEQCLNTGAKFHLGVGCSLILYSTKWINEQKKTIHTYIHTQNNNQHERPQAAVWLSSGLAPLSPQWAGEISPQIIAPPLPYKWAQEITSRLGYACRRRFLCCCWGPDMAAIENERDGRRIDLDGSRLF